MPEVSLFILLLPLGGLAWYSRRWAVLLLLASLSAYVVRTELFGIPTTWLELGIYITLLAWLVRGDWRVFYQSGLGDTRWLVPLLLWLAGGLLGLLVASETRVALGVGKGFMLDAWLLSLIWQSLGLKEANLARWWRDTLAALLIGASATTALALIQFWLTGAQRLQSGYDSPNVLAMFLSPVLVAGAVWFAYQAKRTLLSGYMKWLWLAGLLLIATGVVLTNSYTAMAAVVISLLMAFILHYRLRLVRWFGALILLVSLLTPFLVLKHGQSLLPGHTNETYGVTSGEVRVVLWRTAVNFIKQSPFLGIGLGQWQSEFIKQARNEGWLSIRNPGLAIELHYSSLYPHNLWLTTWLATGLVGVVALVWLVWLAFDRVKSELQLLPLMMLAVQILHGTLDTPLWKNDLSVLWWLPLAAVWLIDKRNANQA